MATSTPVLAYASSILTGTNVNQSSNYTATLAMTAGFEMLVPFEVHFSNVSADPVLSFYRSTDGGSSYETMAMFSVSIARVSQGRARADIPLKTGMYAVQFLNSGPNTSTFFIGTQQILTAYETA